MGIALRRSTYAGTASQAIAPVGIVEFAGADNAKTATDVPLGSMLGALTETAPANDTASSGLNGRMQRLAQRITTLLALIPAALTVSGNFKVAVVEDTVGSAVEATNNTAVVTLNTKLLTDGVTALTPKFAKIVAASSGVTQVVALVASKKIRVLSYVLVANAAVNVKFQSHVTPTDLTGLSYLGANSGVSSGFSHVGHFETIAGEALDINLSGAISVGGHLVYIEV